MVLEGRTFALRKKGEPGLLEQRPVVCILSRKGSYDRPPYNRLNMQDRFLRDVFELMGLGTPHFVIAEGLGRPGALDGAVLKASQEIEELVATL